MQSKLNIKAILVVLTLALTHLSLPLSNKAMTKSTSAPTPGDCISQAFVKVEKVEYRGKNSNGQDLVFVAWRSQGSSSCVWFGGGYDIPGNSNIPHFGDEVTVKVKRRLGHEDSGGFKSSVAINGNQVLTTLVTIPRATLETDPVSFEVKVRTTVGTVLTRTARLTGNGAPSLSTATQTFSQHSSLTDVEDACFPTVQVSALNFLPGAGPKPDRVTINLAAGLSPAAADCFGSPKVSILVRVTRPNGVVDTGQASLDPAGTSASITLPGTPGSVASFEVLVTAGTGFVTEKSSISSGSF